MSAAGFLNIIATYYASIMSADYTQNYASIMASGLLYTHLIWVVMPFLNYTHYAFASYLNDRRCLSSLIMCLSIWVLLEAEHFSSKEFNFSKWCGGSLRSAGCSRCRCLKILLHNVWNGTEIVSVNYAIKWQSISNIYWKVNCAAFIL